MSVRLVGLGKPDFLGYQEGAAVSIAFSIKRDSDFRIIVGGYIAFGLPFWCEWFHSNQSIEHYSFFNRIALVWSFDGGCGVTA